MSVLKVLDMIPYNEYFEADIPEFMVKARQTLSGGIALILGMQCFQ